MSSLTEMTGHPDRAGDPLGGAVTGARLGGGHVRVRHEVHVGAGDAAGVAGQDDRAVGLGQLRQPLGRERRVEQEPARADVQHLGAVADDDERAHRRLDDAVEALAERRARRDDRERVKERLAAPWSHRTSLPGGSSRAGRVPAAPPSPTASTASWIEPTPITVEVHVDGWRRRRHHGPTEPESCGFGQSRLEVAHPAELAAEADLAAHHHVVGHRPRPTRTTRPPARPRGRLRARRPWRHRPRSRTCRPMPGAARPDVRARRAPCRRARRRGPAPSDGRAAGSSARRAPAPRPGPGAGPRSSATTTEPATPGRRSARNIAGRIGHRAQATLGHGEEPDLAGGAEPVLGGAQRAQREVALALERQHGVDHVLEHARTGERALLGDVADHHDRQVGRLRLDDQRVRAVAHLRDRARRRGERRIVQRLDGVDHRAPPGRTSRTWVSTAGSVVSVAR